MQKRLVEPIKLAKIRTLLEIEAERVQIAELDDVSRWIELATSNIPSLSQYRNAFLALEEYFEETGLEGDDLHLWRAYKSFFAQRFSGIYDDILEVTDIIASDLFNYFVKHHLLENVKSRFSTGTIPFTFLGMTEDYYFTYTNDIERPVAVISIPHGRISSVWNWLAIPHEIGHNIFTHFLDFESELWEKLKTIISGQRISINRINIPGSYSGKRVLRTIWRYWLDELIADVFGVLFTGPAFVMSRHEDALQAAQRAGGVNLAFWDLDDMSMSRHPTAYLRPLLGTRMLRVLEFEEVADSLDKRWLGIHKEFQQTEELLWVDDRQEGRIELFTIHFDEILNSFDKILPEILFGKMKCFGGAALTDIVRFDKIDCIISQVIATALTDGTREFARYVKPRHILSASRIAFESDPEKADIIHASAMRGLINFKKHHM